MARALPAFLLDLAYVVVLWLVIGFAGAHLPGADTIRLLSEAPWLSWQLEPLIMVPLIIVGGIYAQGRRRAPATERAPRHAHDAAFFLALLAIFLAIESPIDALADHSLSVHMVEHMFLRTVAPMLLVLAAPQATLIRGMPQWLRRRVVGTIVGSRGVRGTFGAISSPVQATVLFIAVSYFWMIPRFHDAALLNQAVHETWHATLLFSGLIFFWRLFDPRPAPLGSSLPLRLGMVWAAVISDVLLGFYIALKADIIYPVYEKFGLLWGVSPLHNEMYGGQTIWITGTMMIGVAGLITVYRWAASEERREVQRAVKGAPHPRRDAAGEQHSNRKLALGLIGFIAIVVVVMVIAVAGFMRQEHAARHMPGGVEIDVRS